MNLKKKLASIVLALAMVLMIALPVLAQDTYVSYYPITIADTSGVARTGYPVLLSTDGQALIDAGLVKASGLNSRVSQGDASIVANNIPYTMATTQIPVWIESLPASGQAEIRLYTGYTPDALGFDIVVGDGGKITVLDDADLRLVDTFEIEIDDAYVNTDFVGTKNIVYKEDAFRIYVSAAENITATIKETATTETLRPDAAGDETNVAAQEPVTTFHWDKVDEVVSDDFATKVLTDLLPWGRDFYNHPASTGSGIINNITVHAYCNANGGDGIDRTSLKIAIKSGTGAGAPDTPDESGEKNLTLNTWTDENHQWATNPATAAAWTWDEIDNLQIGVNLRCHGTVSAGESAMATQVWVVVSYTPTTSVTAINVESGQHDIKTALTGGTFSISIDSAVAGDFYDETAFAGEVPGNTNDWLIMDNSTTQFMSYMGYYKHTTGIGGVSLKAHYAPATMITSTTIDGTCTAGGAVGSLTDDVRLTQGDDYWNGAFIIITDTTDDLAPEGEYAWVTDFDAGTDTVSFAPAMTFATDIGDTFTMDFGTLVDLVGGDENGIIGWGYNDDVTLTYGKVVSYAATHSEAAEEGGYTAPEADMPAEWYGTATNITDLPLYDMFNGIATETGIPVQTMYIFMITGMCFVFGVVSFVMFNSVVASIIGIGIGLGIGSAMTIVPLWIFFTFLVLAVGIAYLKGRAVLG